MPTSTTTTTTGDDTSALAYRLDDARAIVRRNVMWAMGAGAFPVPLIDLVGITGVQVKLLKQLGDHYGIPFSEHRVKNLVTSLIAGLGSVGIGVGLVFSMLKSIPLVGQIAGVVSIPITAAAITQAVGSVFIQHFESGGTFLDFDPAAVREHFRREFETAKSDVKGPGRESKG